MWWWWSDDPLRRISWQCRDVPCLAKSNVCFSHGFFSGKKNMAKFCFISKSHILKVYLHSPVKKNNLWPCSSMDVNFIFGVMDFAKPWCKVGNTYLFCQAFNQKLYFLLGLSVKPINTGNFHNFHQQQLMGLLSISTDETWWYWQTW